MNETEMVELLKRFLAQDLPGDVTLIYVNIEKTFYGWQIKRDRRDRELIPTPDVDHETEMITLEKWIIGKATVYAGYGAATKVLVIGKSEQVIEPASRIDGDPADSEFFPGVRG